MNTTDNTPKYSWTTIATDGTIHTAIFDKDQTAAVEHLQQKPNGQIERWPTQQIQTVQP